MLLFTNSGTQQQFVLTNINWLGTWSSNTSYLYHDAVFYNGTAYICLENNVNTTPDTNPTKWSVWINWIIGTQDFKGLDGKSAYKVAVDNGFVGTESEWLDSLVGPASFTFVGTEVSTVNNTLNGGKTVTISADMKKSVYDTDADGIVNNSALLQGSNGSYYLSRSNHTGTQLSSTISDLSDQNTRLNIKKSGTSIGTRRSINYIEGDNIGLTISDNNNNEQVDITIVGIPDILKLSQQTNSPSTVTGKTLIYTKTDDKLYFKNSAGIETEIQGLTNVAKTNVANTYTKAQTVSMVSLTDAASISVDASLSNIFTVTLAGNRTLANPTNLVAGQTLIFKVTQDATGSRTLLYGSAYKFSAGTAPTLTTTANKTDIISCISDGTNLYCNFVGNF